ncbi:MAG: low specificity L-threonine aldolase, partial [Planctomycetaceae bacterium]
FAEHVAEIDGLSIDPADVETNLVFFEVSPRIGNAAGVSARLRERGVKIGANGPQRLRACTHLNVSEEDVLSAAEILRECLTGGVGELVGAATGPYARG